MSTTKIFALVFAQGINAVINFLFLPYLVRALTKTDYGTYGQVLLVADLARILFLMGLSRVLYVRLGTSEEHPSVYKNCLSVAFLMGLLGGSSVFLSSGFFSGLFGNPQIAPLLKLYAVQILFFIPFSVSNGLLIFLGKVRASVMIFTFTLILRVIFIVACVELLHSLSAVFISLSILGAIQLGLTLKAIPSRFFREGKFDLPLARSMIGQGMQLGVTDLLAFGIAYTDKFMVSRFLSTEDFAVFRGGSIEIPVIGTLYSSIAAVLLPRISQFHSEGRVDEVVQLKRKIITVTTASIYPVIFFFLFFAGPLMTLYLSEKYAASGQVFAILSLGLLFRVNDYTDLMLAARKERLMISCYLGTFLLNFLLSPILIRVLGYQGAALGTVAAIGVLSVSLFLLSARIAGRSWMEFLDFRRLGLVLLFSAGPPLLVSRLEFGWPPVLQLLFSGLFCFGCAYYSLLCFRVIEYRDFSVLVTRIPFAGMRLDSWLKRHFG